MSASVLTMSMSLDGFVAGPNETPDHGLGDGGIRLHAWFLDVTASEGAPTDAAKRLTGVNGTVMRELFASGAVLAGMGTFEPAHGWNGDHHDGVPIFILTRRDPATLPQWPLVTYLDDAAEAMRRAKAAAGDRNVLVHGVGTTRLTLAAGVLDEIELHVVPVLLGQGRKLFEHLPARQVELDRTRVLEGEHGVTHLHYRVRH